MAEQRDRVRSIERALDVLESIGTAGELGVSEVAGRTGLVPSTAHRVMATLAFRGYLSQDVVSGRYRLGARVLELARSLDLRTAELRGAAHSHLERIREVTGESANLVVLDGRWVVYIDQVEGSHSVRMFTEIGSTVPAHTTGSGKAILAHRSADEVERLYSPDDEPFERPTQRTLVTAAALQEDLARIRGRGYALDREEHEEGVSCVAAAVFDSTGEPVGAISVSGPTSRIARYDVEQLGALLHRHAQEISTTLGWSPDAASGERTAATARTGPAAGRPSRAAINATR
ncbi:MAG: IclR family transcriptional regulator [Solirubrobacteraceae bacterium]|nr:IclR family transcriptional regulator [Solirubrobacteraceae bacterium]